MSAQVVTLVAAGIAATASIASLLLNSRLTINRERRMQLWQYDLEKVRGVEELAGRLAESIGGPGWDRDFKYQEELVRKFQEQTGVLLRHKELNQLMRNFINVAARVVDKKWKHEDPREEVKEMLETFSQLVKECDRVLKRHDH